MIVRLGCLRVRKLHGLRSQVSHVGEGCRTKRTAMPDRTLILDWGVVQSVYLDLSRHTVNLLHDPLCPLNTRGDQLVCARATLRPAEQIVRRPMWRLVRIAAIMPITRLRPSSISA